MNYRGYLIKSFPQSPSLYTIAVEGQGGKIPNMLMGVFTSKHTAQNLIDHYLDNLKVAVNGKAGSKSGD